MERFNLWENADLKKYHGIEATKDNEHGFACEKMYHVGTIYLDINTIKLSSNGLPLLPLKPVGKLEKICRENNANPEQMISAAVFMVDINTLPFGYLVCDDNFLQVKDCSVYVNNRKKVALNVHERKKLFRIIEEGKHIEASYIGWIGRLNAHALTVSPRKERGYFPCCVAIRDYLM